MPASGIHLSLFPRTRRSQGAAMEPPLVKPAGTSLLKCVYVRSACPVWPGAESIAAWSKQSDGPPRAAEQPERVACVYVTKSGSLVKSRNSKIYKFRHNCGLPL
jgi:hypothetical protein